jgi:uncharacterized protein DUF5317
MLLVIAAVACLVSVPLFGGRLARLADLRIRATWAALAAAGLQVWITQAPHGSHAVHVALHFASYALVGVFLLANRLLPGMPVLALGTALNVAAITANDGVMPASASALRIAGIEVSDGFANSAAVAHPHLQWLGDVIPVPGPWPIGNVLSVGDLLIFTGALFLLHRACGSRLPLGRQPVRADS